MNNNKSNDKKADHQHIGIDLLYYSLPKWEGRTSTVKGNLLLTRKTTEIWSKISIQIGIRCGKKEYIRIPVGVSNPQ